MIESPRKSAFSSSRSAFFFSSKSAFFCFFFLENCCTRTAHTNIYTTEKTASFCGGKFGLEKRMRAPCLCPTQRVCFVIFTCKVTMNTENTESLTQSTKHDKCCFLLQMNFLELQGPVERDAVARTPRAGPQDGRREAVRRKRVPRLLPRGPHFLPGLCTVRK